MSKEEQVTLLECLEDDTVARLFLAGFVPGPEPLSPQASNCVREAFAVIDPRTVMTAGLEDDPGRAMAGSMAALAVAMACLSDEEWEFAAPKMGIGPEERAGMVCLMETLGGPGPMAEAMTAAQQGNVTDFAKAAEECGLNMGPAPGQEPATPSPAPKATVAPPTPASTQTPEGATSTPVPATPNPKTTPTKTIATSTATLIITVAAVPADIPDYDRGDWRHWTDEDGDCQDARQEVLVAESVAPVTFETDRQCRVETGRWWAPYLAHHLGNPSHIDVDHHVPLKNAHLSGGWAWDAAKKRGVRELLGGARPT